MPNNEITAQHGMDAFYQQYKTNSDFWTFEDFVYWIGIAFSKIISDEYAQARKEMKAEKEEGYVSFSREWSTEVDVKVKNKDGKSFIELPQSVMSFPFDAWASGIQDINPIGGGKCGAFIRTSGDSKWMLCYVPTTSNTFWYLEKGQRVNFFNSEACDPKQVSVLYIPSADNESFEIPDTRELEVIGLMLNLMISAKEKRPIIKAINDLNRDPAPEVESNIKRPG